MADAFYAPVAFRFRTYGVEPAATPEAICRRCSRIRCLRQWEAAALKETAIIDADEPRVIYRDRIAQRSDAAAAARWLPREAKGRSSPRVLR